MEYGDLIKRDAFKRLSAEGDITIGGQVYRAAALDLVVKRASGNGGWKHVKRFETPEAMEAYWEELKGMADGARERETAGTCTGLVVVEADEVADDGGVNAGHTAGYAVAEGWDGQADGGEALAHTAEAEVVHAPTSARVRAEYERCIGEEQVAKALSTAWRRANAGMLEIMRFGAMLLEVEARLDEDEARCSPVENTLRKRHDPRGGGGLRGWLARKCPEINYKTAYGYMMAAEGLRRMVKVAEDVPLLTLMGEDPIPEERAERLRRKILKEVSDHALKHFKDAARADVPTRPKWGDRRSGIRVSEIDRLGRSREISGDLWAKIVRDVREAVRGKHHQLLDGHQLAEAEEALTAARDAIREAMGKRK